MDHLQKWFRIFRLEETETDFSIWIPTEISGIFDIMERTPKWSPRSLQNKKMPERAWIKQRRCTTLHYICLMDVVYFTSWSKLDIFQWESPRFTIRYRVRTDIKTLCHPGHWFIISKTSLSSRFITPDSRQNRGEKKHLPVQNVLNSFRERGKMGGGGEGHWVNVQ